MEEFYRYWSSKEPKQDVACKKGCHWCCYIPVSCTEIEARVAFEKSDKDDVRRRVKSLRGTNFDMCPFLDIKTKSCSVYDVRPASCRQYTSFSKLKCMKAHEKRDDNALIDGDILRYMHWNVAASYLNGEKKRLSDWLKGF